ncbi:Zinc finger CCCH domain-containing protein 4 [Branchiostoma belcheri]|nr:Zinc finger CCCH domain-containing protein 4 [Branchiostoma belcheri]
MMSMLEGDDMDINIAANEGESFAGHHRGGRGAHGGPGRGRSRGRGTLAGPPMKMRGRPRPRVLCKFWMEGRCAKFYHTGKPCYQDENCRFSHDPLTEETKALLDKYLAREQEDQELRRQEQEQQPPDNEQEDQLPPPPPIMQQEPYRGPMPPPKGVGLLPTPNIPPDPHANDPKPKIPSLFEIKVEPPKKLMHRFFGEAVSPTKQGPPPGPPMNVAPGPSSLDIHAQQTAGFYHAFYSQQGGAESPQENEGWNEEDVKPITDDGKVETEEASDHAKEGMEQHEPPELEQSHPVMEETKKAEEEDKGGETTETAPEESSAKESESDTEGKKLEVAGGPDLSHMPHRQRALFLRIQQKQHQESLDKEGKSEESKKEEKQEENWYSSEEDEEDDREGDETSQPLTNILRTLREQASSQPTSNSGGNWPSAGGGLRPRSVWGEDKQELAQNNDVPQLQPLPENWPADPRARLQGVPQGPPSHNWPRAAQAPESQVPNPAGQAWPSDPRRARDPRAQLQDPRSQGTRSTDPRLQPQANNKMLDPRSLSRDEDFEEPDEPTTPMTPTTPGGGHRLLSQPAIIPLEPQSHQVDPRLTNMNHLQPRQVVLEQLARYGQSGGQPDSRMSRTMQSDPRLVRSQSDPRLQNGQAGKPQDPRARGGNQQGPDQMEQSHHPMPNHRVEEDIGPHRGPRMEHAFGRQGLRQQGPNHSPPQFPGNQGGPHPPAGQTFPGNQSGAPLQGNEGRERFPGHQGQTQFPGNQAAGQATASQGGARFPGSQGGGPFPGSQGGARFPGIQGTGQGPDNQGRVPFPGNQSMRQFSISQNRPQFLGGQAAQLARSDPRLARQGSDPQPLQKPAGDPRLQRKGSLPAQPSTNKAMDPRLARLQGAPDPRLQRQVSREKGQDPRLARQGRLPPEQTGEPTVKASTEKASEKSEPTKLAPYDPRLLSGSLKSGAKATSSPPSLPPYDPRAMNKTSSSGPAASGGTSQRKFVIPKAANTGESQVRMTRQGLDRGQHVGSTGAPGDNTAKYNAYNRPRPRPAVPTVTTSGPMASMASSAPSTNIPTPVISMYGSAKAPNNPQGPAPNRPNQSKDESLKDVFKTFDPTASPFELPCMQSDGWDTYLGSTTLYLLVEESKSFAEAEQTCLSKGGHLAMANDPAEFDLLMELADDVMDKDVWIGVKQIVLQDGGSGEFKFCDNTSQPFIAEQWKDPPDGSEKCVRIKKSDGYEDRDCGGSEEFICECVGRIQEASFCYTPPTTTAPPTTTPPPPTTTPMSAQDMAAAFASGAVGVTDSASWEDFLRWRSGDALPPGYDKNESPRKDGAWIDVATSVYIRRVDWLSEENANLSMTVEYNLAWADDRLTAAVRSGWMPLPPTLLWTPALMFGNKVRRVQGITKPRVGSSGVIDEVDVSLKMWLHTSGFVVFQMTKVLKALCNLDLHKYPFDDQECPIQLHAYNGVRFSLNPSTQGKLAPISSDASNVVSQFRLMGTTIESTYSTFFANDTNDVACPYFRETCAYDVEHCMLSALMNCSTCGDCAKHVGDCSHNIDICGDPGPTVNTYTTLTIRVTLSRRIWLYVFRTFVPTLMVVVLSWMSPWMGFQIPAVIGRVYLGASALLTIVMGADLKQPMEFISYARAIDVWMSGCLMVVFCGLLETAVAYYIHHRRLSKDLWKKQLVQPKVRIPRARFCRPYYLLQYLPPPPAARTVRFRLPGAQPGPPPPPQQHLPPPVAQPAKKATLSDLST